MTSNPSTRRRFLRHSALSAAPLILPSGMLMGAEAPSNRITVGMIGTGSRANGHLGDLARRAEVQIVTLCDVDSKHLEAARNRVSKDYAKRDGADANSLDLTDDYREVCAREDVDAVVISTPDHWHALAGVEAARAGKHIYCEKPVTHLFREGQILRDEVAKAGVIFQVGSQQRSDLRFRRAAEIVRNGLLGKIQKVEIGLPTGKSKADRGAGNTTVPETLNYDRWVGPSPMIDYDSGRCHWSWRWHTYFGGGQLMDWIGHHNDIAHWGLGLDDSGPDTVESSGWKMTEFPLFDTPVDYEVKCTYADGLETSLANKYPNGLKWIGEEGWMFVKRGGIEASNREWISDKFDRGPEKLYETKGHVTNWLDGIRTGKECICPAATGHRSITPGHLGWVSYHLDRKLKWDPATETIVGDAEADAALKALDYRGEWSLA